MATATNVEMPLESDPALMIEFQTAKEPVVVVTGSSGLIGSKVVETLSFHHRVVCLDVERPKQNVVRTEWIECDMTSDESVSRALTEIHEKYEDRLSSVIHLATYYDFSGESGPHYRTLTVEGTRRLLRGLRRFQVDQFVFSSTLLAMEPVEEEETITEEL